MRDSNINIRCKKELKEDLEELASEDASLGRKTSFSDYVNGVLTQHVEETKKDTK